MADVSKILLNGETLNVKDATARQNITKAQNDISTAQQAIVTLGEELANVEDAAIKLSYNQSTETITATTIGS